MHIFPLSSGSSAAEKNFHPADRPQSAQSEFFDERWAVPELFPKGRATKDALVNLILNFFSLVITAAYWGLSFIASRLKNNFCLRAWRAFNWVFEFLPLRFCAPILEVSAQLSLRLCFLSHIWCPTERYWHLKFGLSNHNLPSISVRKDGKTFIVRTF